MTISKAREQYPAVWYYVMSAAQEDQTELAEWAQTCSCICDSCAHVGSLDIFKGVAHAVIDRIIIHLWTIICLFSFFLSFFDL